jgi:hypothetical protein
MRKIKLFVNTGFVNAKHTEVIEVEDDTTDKELNEIANDFAANYIEIGWTEINEDNEDDN